MPTDPAPYILQMRPKLVPKVWGGERLGSLFHKELEAERTGEAWEIADLEEGCSTIGNGAWAGEPLRRAVEAWGEALGPVDEEGRFALLVKILDAREDLSVQVHPGTENASRWPGARSKDECWYILDARPGAAILHGLKGGASAESLRRAVEQGDPVGLLRRHEVVAGQIVRVPPGTQHAICAGVALLEIQQPSDTTFRVWDYERPGLDGKPRELHLEEAIEATNFGAQPPIVLQAEPIGPGHDRLVDAPPYRVERHRTRGRRRGEVGQEGLAVICTRGAVSVEGATASVRLERGGSALIPAALGDVEVSGADFEIVTAHAKG